MAIEFIKSLPEDVPLHAYNDNTVSFRTNSVYNPVKAVITVLGNYFEITPDSSGVFKYNFKHIIKSVINDNNFSDEIEPDISNELVYSDNGAFKIIDADYFLLLDNDNDEDVIKSHVFLKGVLQEEEYRKGLYVNGKIGLLSPYTNGNNKVFSATYFEGYPFDVSIYSDQARTVTVRNKKTNISFDVDLSQGVNRLFISDGSSNLSFEDELPLQYGINEIEIEESSGEIITILLRKLEAGCGTYLKWLNPQGGWSYFLFDRSQGKRSSKVSTELFDLYSDFSELKDKSTPIKIDSKESHLLRTADVLEYEKLILSNIIDSPKVYKYLPDVFQGASRKDWIQTKIKSGSVDIIDSTKKKFRAVVEIGNVERKTMSL